VLSPEVDEKIKAARMKFVFDKKTAAFYMPFSYLPIYEDPNSPTLHTNGQAICVNPEFIIGLCVEDVMGCLFHEYIHNAIGHTAKEQPKVTHKNVMARAEEIAVNNIVLECGLQLPDIGLVIDKTYRGWSTLAIYKDLVDKGKTNENTKPGCGCASHDFPPDIPRTDLPKLPDQNEILRKLSKIQGALAHAGSSILTRIIGDLVDEAATPSIDFADKLTDSIVKSFDGCIPDYSNPIPQYMPDIYMPKLKSEIIENFYVAVDLSYSCSREELTKAQAVINAVRDTYEIETTVLITYNHEIIDRLNFSQYEPINICELEGDGGTRGDAVFEYIQENCETPHTLVVISDTEDYISTPAESVPYPVIWLNTSVNPAFGGEHNEPTFGEIISI